MSQDTEEFQHWRRMVEELNEEFSDAVERNAEAHAEFMQAWLDAVTDASDDDRYDDAAEGYRRAYETWMRAAQGSLESVADAAAGEDVPVEEFRDRWLAAANESLKELMRTSAFAAATGETVDELLDLKRQRDEAVESALDEAGVATRTDVREVGQRLVELERRQQAVERRLDLILDALSE